MHDVLARSVRRALHRAGGPPAGEDAIVAIPTIDRLIEVDQAPIGRTPRSTPATATGVFDEIRRVFATTREARIRGYGPSRFSFNARGGRCEACLGLGHRRIPMHYLPDLYVTCEECGGLRYNRQTLEIRFKGKSIGEILELRVDEALALFDAVPRVRAGLEALHDVGLGYLTLGQSSTTLSGGEAQRVKLAAELGRPAPSGGRTLYILDEPTTGLHFADIDRLLRILHRLVDLGHTVVGHRAPPRRHRLGRLGHRPGPRGRRGRRPGRRHGAARRHRRRPGEPHRHAPSFPHARRFSRQNPGQAEKTPRVRTPRYRSLQRTG